MLVIFFLPLLINYFLIIGRSFGAGLIINSFAKTSIAVIVFGVLLFSLSCNPAEKAFCATVDDSALALESLLATFTPEQLGQFNQRMEIIAPQHPSVIESILLAVAINIAIITFVHYAPIIWDTVVNIVQGMGRGAGNAARELAIANFERVRNDPELFRQVGELIIEIAQQGGAAGGAA